MAATSPAMLTLTVLRRISVSHLAELLLADPAPGASLAVVDMRDDDRIGGHVRGSIHVPSRSAEALLPGLVRRLADARMVVFHCAQSRQRGPAAALRYLRLRADNPPCDPLQEQDVLVLDGGFIAWQRAYGRHDTLTESFRPELWDDAEYSS